MAQKDKKSAKGVGLKRFNKVVRETRKYLKQQGYSDSYHKSQKYASLYVYPELKKLSNHRLSKAKIAQQAARMSKIIDPQDFFSATATAKNNVFNLPWGQIDSTPEFWALHEVIKELIPDNLKIQVDAGVFGRISPFLKRYLAQHEEEIQDIVAEIRDAASTRKKPYGDSTSFSWVASIYHKDGTKENGAIKNYIVSFDLLDADGDPVFDKKNRKIKGYSPTMGIAAPSTPGVKPPKKEKEFRKKTKKQQKEFITKVTKKKYKKEKPPSVKKLEAEVKSLRKEVREVRKLKKEIAELRKLLKQHPPKKKKKK